MSEIANLLKSKVFNIISLSDLPFGSKIFPIISTFLTKRTKESNPEQEELEKRKAWICLGGHLAIEGVHYQKMDAYAPVPTWATIKLQLALTSRHKLQLHAFDCVAAYLQANFKEPIYAHSPKGLISELGHDSDKVWELNRALYGWPPSGRIWFYKVPTWLLAYGFALLGIQARLFRTLGNSGTFMMLDRREHDDGDKGIILLNLYIHDGHNGELWDSFCQILRRILTSSRKTPRVWH